MRIAARGLSLETHDGAALDDAAVHALWRLRLEFMRLKPDVDESADRAAFAAIVRESRTVGVFRTDEGLQGFATFRHRPAIVAGSRVVFVLPTYGFVRPGFRGHPLSVVLAAAAIARVALAFPRHRIVAVESWYPLSYLVVAPKNPGMWSLSTPGISAWQRAVLRHAIDAFWAARFDPQTGVVRLNTLPPPAEFAHASAWRADTQRVFAAYVAENPRWAEGFALPAAVELGPAVAIHFARALARRALRFVQRRRSEPRDTYTADAAASALD